MDVYFNIILAREMVGDVPRYDSVGTERLGRDRGHSIQELVCARWRLEANSTILMNGVLMYLLHSGADI